ncbi:MAG: hypothetical protein ACI3XJ_03115 [Oscillospiraceae bacterium]
MSEFEDKLQSILGNPEAMSQIMSIAQSITGNSNSGSDTAEEEPDPPPSESQAAGDPLSMLGNLDPRLVQMGMRLLSEYNSTDDRKVALLTALQPFVREERYAKVDKAIQIAKLAHVIRVALDVFRKGDGDHV